MNKQKIKQAWKDFLETDQEDLQDWRDDHDIYYRTPTTEQRLRFTNYRLQKLMGVINKIVEEITVDVDDPCPGCFKGGVCRTFKCGRLKLPTDHPLRNQP